MASSKGRCPFPENVDGRVVVALVGHATRTGPDAVAQGDARIAGAADMTALTGRKPRVDVVHDGPSLRRHMMQPLDEVPKAQIRHLAAPQGFHASEIQRLQHDAVILRAELMRQIPMKRLTHMGHALMHTRQMAPSTAYDGASRVVCGRAYGWPARWSPAPA